MRNNKVVNIILSKVTVIGVQLVASVIALYSVVKLDIVPRRYLFVVIAAVVVLLVLFAGIMIWGDKKESSKKRSGVAKVMSLILSVLLVVTTSYISRGHQFIDNISEKTTEKYVVSVMVLQDNPAQVVEDVNGQPVSVSYQNETKTTTEAIAHFEEESNVTFDLKRTDTYQEAAKMLYDGEVEAIVIGHEHIALLEANATYEHFSAQTREIARYSVEKEMTSTTKSANVTEEPFTIYLAGNDTYGDDVSVVAKSDVNLVVTVNPKTKQILMVSIPRDTQIYLDMNGAMDKLTHTGMYGIGESRATLENFLDVDINYYARTNFTGIQEIVDQLGGVEIDSPYDDFVTRHGHYTIKKGINELDGDKALCFVRERYAFEDGDFERGKNQQRLLNAMLKKAMSPKIITNFDNILSAVEGTFETDMSSSDIRALLSMQLDDMAEWEVFNVQVGFGRHDNNNMETYSAGIANGEGVYVMIPDQYSVTHIRDLIDKIHAGEVLVESEVDQIESDPEVVPQYDENTDAPLYPEGSEDTYDDSGDYDTSGEYYPEYDESSYGY